jgi:ribosomal protein S18 acetylase RimI-like enzyme
MGAGTGDPIGEVLQADRLAARGLSDATGLATVVAGEGFDILRNPTFPFASGNGMRVAGPTEGPAIDAMREARRSVEAEGLPFGVVTVEGRTPRVDAAAEAMGLTTLERQTLMRVDREDFRPVPLDVPNGRVRMATTTGDLDGWVDTMGEGFEMPSEPFRRMALPIMLEPHVRAIAPCWLLEDGDGTIVSTACAIRGGDGVFVGNVATPPRFRRRGFASMVISHAVLAAFEEGRRFAFLEASDEGLGVYRRLGFGVIGTTVCRSAPIDG